MHKVHVALYTCAASRGIFLDVVEDLSALSFLNSLRRFIAERGVPRLIVSDHGSAFVAAETQAFVAEKLIRWQYNLEAAPWWGGLFESLVKSVKNCLKKTVGLKRINFIELQTILKEIQMILNNRPLCEPVEEDCDFLTPNSVLFGRRLQSSNQQLTINDAPEQYVTKLSKRFTNLNWILDHFWKIWRQEYIASLRDIHARQSFKKGGDLNLNEIVIVVNEKLPRYRWSLGRVVELIRGKDGVLRGARVLLGKTGAVIGRPLNKLCRLELGGESEKIGNAMEIEDDLKINDEQLEGLAPENSVENTCVINEENLQNREEKYNEICDDFRISDDMKNSQLDDNNSDAENRNINNIEDFRVSQRKAAINCKMRVKNIYNRK